MSNLVGAPEEVLVVHRLLVENAEEAGYDASFVYCREERRYPGYQPSGNWLVGPNMEGFGGTMVRTSAGNWFYREAWSGEDIPMKAGFEEAKSDASCWFTG